MTPPKPLRVLVVEDVEADAILLVRELKRGGFQVTFQRVDTPDAMANALTTQPWDIIISDYSMPQFSAPRALALIRERNLDIPLIIVSGTVNETLAVEMMRAGARDFMAKDNFTRMIPAIERELAEAKGRAERTKMQEQLLISDRMASIGTLAAGVAHEINNPLAAVMASLYLAAEDLAQLTQDVRAKADESPQSRTLADLVTARLTEVEKIMQDAQDSANRVRLIVRDLKVFSRSDDEKTEAVDVRRVLESSLRMAWNEVRHRAALVKDYGDVPLVQGNEARLGQVFLNLVVNAAQAIPEGHADQNEIRVTSKELPQGWVSVEIRDTGSGIPEHIQSRIFDPFFTTKPIGVGTGLGLAICHRIITALGGQIHIDSQVGQGTTVRTLLPILADDTLHTPPPLAAPVAAPQSHGTILVIDDEPLLGTIIHRALSPDHQIFAVTSAQEALALIAQGARYDVIFCDLMMPQMTGMDLHAEISLRAPELADKMVFMTGGAFTARARSFFDSVHNYRLEKPFDLSSLRAVVHRLLRPT